MNFADGGDEGTEDNQPLVFVPASSTRYNFHDRGGLRSRRERWKAVSGIDGGGVSTTMAQVSMKKGLALYGDEGAIAVREEMEQLYRMGALEPVGGLSAGDRKRSLTYLMYLKKKSDGRNKGRRCANGRK